MEAMQKEQATYFQEMMQTLQFLQARIKKNRKQLPPEQVQDWIAA
jgi:hypothetical protein